MTVGVASIAVACSIMIGGMAISSGVVKAETEAVEEKPVEKVNAQAKADSATLKAGAYIIGEDIRDGIADIIRVSGSGNIMIYDKNDKLILNI